MITDSRAKPASIPRTHPGRQGLFARVALAVACALAGFTLTLWLLAASSPTAVAATVAMLNGGLSLLVTWLAIGRRRAALVSELSAGTNELLDGLNLAGQAAGVHAWDWDLTANTLRFDRSLLGSYGWEEGKARSPQALIEQAVFKDDYAHYRGEFIKALKGDGPLCIDYRVVDKDGTLHPIQLRGQVFRGPDRGGVRGRATRVVGITVDMRLQAAHEARLAEHARQQQQLAERLSLATEVAGIGVWDWDLARDDLNADRNMAAIFKDTNLSGAGNAREFVQKILHPDDRERFISAMAAATSSSGGERVSLAFRYLREDGSIQHAELQGRIIRKADGRARRFLGVSYNVTARMESQAEIERQSAAQRLLLERLNLATEVAGLDVWDWDLVSDRFTADAYMTRAYAGTRFDLPSGWQLLTQIVHPEDLEDFLDILKRAMATGNPLSYRYRIMLPDGRKRHVQTQARVFRDAQGKAVRMLGVNIDKTEEVNHLDELRKQADGERALRDRLNLATQTAGISVWDKDLVSGSFMADANFWNMLGIAEPDPQFKPHDGIHPSMREAALRPINEALADPTKNEVLSIRHRTASKRPEPLYFQTHMRVFRDGWGKPIRLLGVTWDVTREVQYEEELKRKAEQERALVDRLNRTTKAAGIAPWEFDLKTDKMSWHGVTLPVYGFGEVASEDFMRELNKIVVDEDRPLLRKAGAEAFEKGLENYVYHFRVHGIDGKIHHIRNICSLIRNERGKYRYIMGVTMDVTAEVEANGLLAQRAEENRRLSERLSMATESAGIGSWEMDLQENRYLWVENPVKSLGIAPEDFGGLDEFTERVVPDDRKMLSTAIKNSLSDGSHRFGLCYRAFGENEQIVHVQTYGRVIVDEQQLPVRALGVSWDVTREAQAAERLKVQAELERALLNRLNVATQAAGISPWEFDLKANRFVWSGARLGILGLDDEPLESYFAALENVVVPEDRTILRDAAAEAIKKNLDVYSYRYRATGIDGQMHYMKNYVRILRSDQGTPYRLVGVTWDISEEVAANQRLEEQVKQAQTFKDRLGIATLAASISPWEIDLVRNEFNWLENPLIALTGGTDEMVVTMAELGPRILPEDRNNFMRAVAAAAKGGYDTITYRYRAKSVADRIVHIHSHAKVIFNEERRAVRALGVSWDVTKEVLAETQLREHAEQQRELMTRLSFALQAAGISLWEFDLKVNRYTWTGRRLPLLGLDDVPVEDYYSRINDLIVPEDLESTHDAPRRTIDEGRDHYSCRYRVRGADGNIHHLQNSVRILRSERGRAYKMVGITWDVTAEVHARMQLEQQAEQERKLLARLNIATDSAGISTWEIDLQAAKFLWIENPIVSVHLDGDTDSDMSTAYYVTRILPDDRDNMRKAMRAARDADSDRIEYRYRAIGREGAIVHVQCYARIIADESDIPLRVLGVSWDISREVAAAEQLRLQTEKLLDAERRLERASLSSSEGHWEAELASGHLWCSSSFHTLLGYRQGELEDRVSALDRLVFLDDRQAYLDALRNHLKDGATYDVETRLRTASGDYRWFRMRGTAERDAAGQPTVMAGSIHDIHQQKIIEDALDLAQRRYERAINGTQDGLWELDVVLDHMWCSPRLALLLGFPAEQLEADNFLRTLIHPDDAAKIQEVTLAHYRQNLPFDLELRLKTRSGEFRWYRARASADRDDAGRALRLSGSLQDVTDARAAREELVRATEAAEAASRAKSAFLANVSHEIRTPMNGIIGMTGLLLETELDRTQRDYADTIRGSADSLLTVINDILDFSKIEAGKLDLENVEMDLRANVEDVGAMMAFQAASKGLEFIVNVHPEVPQRVLGDPQRLRQCLINLVGNAIKFTRSGEVVLDVCAVGRHDGRVLTHFEVRDTGIGIPDKALKTLFQPFVQADSSTTRHFGGTGLGLSIVRRLVEMMGGQVGVVSEVGQGSTFFFTLSLEPVEGEAASQPARTSRRGRILIVDDNATNRRVLVSQLTHAGHMTVATASAADAFATLQQASAQGAAFDMVVTDFQMPDMDGAMLGEQISRTPGLQHTRLIMLTSLDRQGDTPRLAAIGFAAYLTKPVRSGELLECIERVLGGEARQWQMEVRPMITRNTLTQANAERRFAGHVLVVEDNVVNQKVVVRFLERMGCTVQIADNGAEGVAAALREPFDLVLMDLQMPVMDGLSATQLIREQEKGRRTPIIALTANAMRGDQERCEAAGMDGFLTKPIDVERLRDALSKFGMSAGEIALEARLSAGRTAIEATAESPPVDLARLNEITDGDPEFTRELIETFIVSIDEQLTEINDALAANDRIVLARAAHKLKGACANIQAHEMRATTAALETNAANLSADELLKMVDRLRVESDRTKHFLLQTLPPEQRRAM